MSKGPPPTLDCLEIGIVIDPLVRTFQFSLVYPLRNAWFSRKAGHDLTQIPVFVGRPTHLPMSSIFRGPVFFTAAPLLSMNLTCPARVWTAHEDLPNDSDSAALAQVHIEGETEEQIQVATDLVMPPAPEVCDVAPKLHVCMYV